MSANFSLDHLDPDVQLPEPELHYFSRPVRELINCNSRPEMLSYGENGKWLEEEIWRLIEESGVNILSFDVFDTYLLRNNKPEALRYLEMSKVALERLQKNYPINGRLQSMSAEDLCLTRIMGMQATYRTRPLVKGCGEGLIDEVYSMQSLLLGLGREANDIFLEVEIDYEVDNLVENPVLSRIAERFKRNGGRVVLVSDMYLDAESISRIVGKVVSASVYDRIFSSADEVVSKRSGKIFPVVEHYFGAEGNDFMHIGDSWIGDVQQPRKAGWKAMFFPVSEKELLERRKNLSDFVSRMHEQGIEVDSWAKL